MTPLQARKFVKTQRRELKISSFFNIIKADLNRAIISKYFILGIIGAVSVMIFGSIGMVSPNIPAAPAFEYSYCDNNVIHLLFLADAFVYSSSFSIEWQTGYYRSNIIRCNIKQYAVSKCIATAIASGIAITLGAGLYIIGLCIYQPAIMPNAFGTQILVTTFNDILSQGHYILYFLSYLYIIFLQAMFFSVLGLTVSGFFPNKYVAYTTPLVAGFAINQLTNSIRLPVWFDPVKLALAKLYGIPTPIVLTIETVAFVLFTLISSAVFVRAVQRRLANG